MAYNYQFDQHVYAFRRYVDEWMRREYRYAGEDYR